MELSIVIIYLIVGLAHMVTHIIECQGCKSRIHQNLDWALELGRFVVAWPWDLFFYIKNAVMPLYKDAPDFVQVGIKKILRMPNENVHDFARRIGEEVNSQIEQANANLVKEDKNAGGPNGT